MAKIYSAPGSIKKPVLNFRDIDGYRKDCDRYLAELKEILVNRKNQPNVGVTIKFPVADGHAVYMVASMKPLELVHVELWDGWHFQYAKNLTVKDVEEKIAQDKAMAELFSKKN
jgi:hypothetical protein